MKASLSKKIIAAVSLLLSSFNVFGARTVTAPFDLGWTSGFVFKQQEEETLK